MTTQPDSPVDVTDIISRYLTSVASGDPDAIVDMYADGATAPLNGSRSHTELLSLAAVGREAAFQFAVTVDSGESRIRLEPHRRDGLRRQGKDHLYAVLLVDRQRHSALTGQTRPPIRGPAD